MKTACAQLVLVMTRVVILMSTIGLQENCHVLIILPTYLCNKINVPLLALII